MRKIKIYTLFLQFGLLISGITAFFIPEGVAFLILHTPLIDFINLNDWLAYVLDGVLNIDRAYPFIWYGTDWMVFAHILFAILFCGLYTDPIRNIWLIRFGYIACILIFPLALIMGEIREIPMVWRLLDCGFGVLAGLVLFRIHTLTKRLPNFQYQHAISTDL